MATRLVRIYVDRDVAARLDGEAARMVGDLGRFVPKADLYAAIATVGLTHRDEVMDLLAQPPEQ